MKNFLKSWKTNSAGLGLIVSGIGLWISDPTKSTEAIGMIIGGIGLIFAKDSNVDKSSNPDKPRGGN